MCYRWCVREGAALTKAVKEAFNEYLGSSSVRVENHALCAYVSKHLLHPTHASVYDVIALTIAPLIVNVELDVVEQLASIFEKELAVIAMPTVTSILMARQKLSTGNDSEGERKLDIAAGFVAPKTLQLVRNPPIIHRVRDLKKLTQMNFRNCQQSVFLSSPLSAAPPVFYSLPRYTTHATNLDFLTHNNFHRHAHTLRRTKKGTLQPKPDTHEAFAVHSLQLRCTSAKFSTMT